DPLVHHGHHFGRAVHAFCNTQTLLTNAIVLMSEGASDNEESLTAIKRKEYSIFRELLRMIPGLEARLMISSEKEVMSISEYVKRSYFLKSSL
ncbi:hypothetical protein HYDPIDRAFT_103508, partial [Hydnomerulius pinastri MD-312]